MLSFNNEIIYLAIYDKKYWFPNIAHEQQELKFWRCCKVAEEVKYSARSERLLNNIQATIGFSRLHGY